MSSPYGWPSYVAKSVQGIAKVEDDGSASFTAPAGKLLYFQALDKDFNEFQRMRSVVRLQPGEMRSCVGCHNQKAERGFNLAATHDADGAPAWFRE